MNRTRYSVIAGMIFAGAAARLLPHPPNFTPLGALALFGGACFADKRLALLVPLAALFLSDLVLGLHHQMVWVYGSFALTVGLGFLVRRLPSVVTIASATSASAVLLFAITNFGVWATGTLYPPTVRGLLNCYVAAVPFFRNALFSTLLFGVFATAVARFPRLREPALASAIVTF